MPSPIYPLVTFPVPTASPISQTLLVAANSAPAGVKAAANYVCDGTADESEINTALAALASAGGVVRLSEGTFNIASSILVQQDGAALIGANVGGRQGGAGSARGTFLKAATGLTTAVIVVKQAADVRPVEKVLLRNLNVDGNSVGSGVDGIYFSSFQGLIEHCFVHNCTGDGIQVQGYGPTPGPSWTTYDTVILNCHSDHNTLSGIRMAVYSGDVHVIGCVLEQNSQNGIHNQSAGNQFLGGQYYDNAMYGILLDNSGAQIQIQDIKIENSGRSAIYFDATTTGPSQVMIVGCGFRLNCKSVDNTYDVIGGTGSGSACTGVLITGCRFNSAIGTSSNLPRYGVNLWNATACQQWCVTGNQFARNPSHWGTAPINVTGTPAGIRIRNNNGAPDYGYRGTATIPSGSTAVTVTHNLPYTPAAGDIQVTPTNSPTNDPGNFWIDTYTSTQFNLNVRANPGASGASFAWRAG